MPNSLLPPKKIRISSSKVGYLGLIFIFIGTLFLAPSAKGKDEDPITVVFTDTKGKTVQIDGHLEDKGDGKFGIVFSTEGVFPKLHSFEINLPDYHEFRSSPDSLWQMPRTDGTSNVAIRPAEGSAVTTLEIADSAAGYHLKSFKTPLLFFNSEPPMHLRPMTMRSVTKEFNLIKKPLIKVNIPEQLEQQKLGLEIEGKIIPVIAVRGPSGFYYAVPKQSIRDEPQATPSKVIAVPIPTSVLKIPNDDFEFEEWQRNPFPEASFRQLVQEGILLQASPKASPDRRNSYHLKAVEITLLPDERKPSAQLPERIYESVSETLNGTELARASVEMTAPLVPVTVTPKGGWTQIIVDACSKAFGLVPKVAEVAPAPSSLSPFSSN